MSQSSQNRSVIVDMNLKLYICAATGFCINSVAMSAAFGCKSSLAVESIVYTTPKQVSECGSGFFIFAALAFFWGSIVYLKFFANSPIKALDKNESKKSKSNPKANTTKANTFSPTKDADNAAKLNDALQYMQCAIDRACQAETAAARANNGVKDARLSASYEAQCHADSARAWADKAATRTYSANSAAQDAASKAREAAYRAQAAADRAKYSAANA
ncbi:MAG: hypothetical protein K2X81_00310 [Candidatus Obscuribacterales bacterium]|nr:hypothetical protein [Candidatus Obscuribacterales bacterium]